MTPRVALAQRGWVRFAADPVLLGWVQGALPAARAAVADPANAAWDRCGGTWFAGVNVLPNDHTGAVGRSGPLRGTAVDALAALDLPVARWDQAQVSVIRPGYPRQDEGEGDAAFRFRRDRDAAHVDGLLPVGTRRRRMLGEPHAFILGLPMSAADPGASPLVVWEGSHDVMRRALGAVLNQRSETDWRDADLTEAYQMARREVFASCPRVPVHAGPGEAYVLHRLALHGVAPWAEGARAAPEGRMIAYFRPEIRGPIRNWIAAA